MDTDLRGNWAKYREYVQNTEELDWTYGETRTHDGANRIDTRDRDFDGPNGLYFIRDGIICIPRGTIIPNGTEV